MYPSFYNLRENPFGINTDPKFLWLGEKHREALATLKYGLIEANGYVVLTGDVGTGKTTIVNALIDTLDNHVLVATINHPTVNTLEFLNLISRSFNLSAEITSKSQFLSLFTDFLKTSKDQGKVVLLVIDEAHRLSMELLEEIRLLSNIEQTGASLINIFFVGQDELKQILFAPECRAIRQRITLFYEIEPLSEGEVTLYIEHRLKIAGGETNMFTLDALYRIQEFTQGYPRLINTLCNHALLTGFIREQKEIDAGIIEESTNDIQFLDPKTSPTLINGTQNSSRRGNHLIQKLLNILKFSENQKSQGNTIIYRRLLLVATGALVLISIAAGLANYIQLPDIDKSSESLNNVGVTNEARKPDDLNIQVIQPPPIEIEPGLKTQNSPKRAAILEVGESRNTESTSVEQPPPKNSPLIPAQSLEQPVSPQKTTFHPASAALVSGDVQEPADQVMQAIKPAPKEIKSIRIKNTPQTQGEILDEETEHLSKSHITSLAYASEAVKQNNFQLAIDLLENEKNPDGERFLESREVYIKALAGRAEQILISSPDESENLLLKSIEIAPGNTSTHLTLGKLYFKTKKYTSAIDAYQQAVELDPKSSKALFNLGFIYATTGNYEEAENQFTRVVELKPSYLDKALFNLALVQEKLRKIEDCVENLRLALTINPDNQRAQRYLQQLFGDLDEDTNESL